MYFNNLILVFKTNSSHSTLNRVNCENKFCPRWNSNLRQASSPGVVRSVPKAFVVFLYTSYESGFQF